MRIIIYLYSPKMVCDNLLVDTLSGILRIKRNPNLNMSSHLISLRKG